MAHRDGISIPELPEVVSQRMGFALSKAARLFRRAIVLELEPFGLHLRHYFVLILLSESGPLSQQEIGQKLCIDRTTVMHIIDDLEERGLVVREKNPKDRRMYAVRVTEAARDVLKSAYDASVTAENRFLAPLDPPERRQLHYLLNKLLVEGP